MFRKYLTAGLALCLVMASAVLAQAEEIKGRVYENFGDGAYDPGEGDRALEGVEVQLLDGVLLDPLGDPLLLDVRVTESDGTYTFGDRPAGSYLVKLATLPSYRAPTDPPESLGYEAREVYVDKIVTPTGDLTFDMFSNTIAIVDPAAGDFDAIEVGGMVTVSGTTSNDGSYMVVSKPSATAIVVSGPLVDEIVMALPPGSPSPASVTQSTKTDVTEPEKRMVPDVGPVNVMGASVTSTGLRNPLVRLSPEDDSTFFLLGTTFRDVGSCDGTYNKNVDAGVAGIQVRVRYPDLEFVDDEVLTTDGDGGFLADGFLEETGTGGLPTLMVSWKLAGEPDAAFDAREFAVDTVRNADGDVVVATTNIRVEDCVAIGSLGGFVFGDAAPFNGTRDAAENGLGGVTVQLRSAAGAVLATATSAADGSYEFSGLDTATYRVVALAADLSEAASALGFVDGGAATANLPIRVEGGGPETCPAVPCQAGKLHEAVVEIEIWVGGLPTSVAVSAALYTGADATSALADVASLGYLGTTFPGPAQGLDEILTIEDVRFSGGWGTVRVHLVADPRVFPDGSFGDVTRLLEVSLNGRRESAAGIWRCENVRVGGRLGFFRVLETGSQEAWAECSGFEPPEPPAPPPPPPPPAPPAPECRKRCTPPPTTSCGRERPRKVARRTCQKTLRRAVKAAPAKAACAPTQACAQKPKQAASAKTGKARGASRKAQTRRTRAHRRAR